MLKIGEKIKKLRKQQDITQEKLADYLNISYQAISKWENATAYPDITLVPKIASFFGVTTDELLCIHSEQSAERLEEYEKRYSELNRKGKTLERIHLAREVLEIYPRNYQWMLNLSYGLIAYCATDEQRQYSKEHGFEEEAIAVCERVLEDCTIDSIRHSAIQILCYTYPKYGKTDKAIELANQMPDMLLCRDALLSRIYRGEEQIKQNQQNLLSMIDMSAGILFELSSFRVMNEDLNVDEKIQFVEAAVTLYQTVLQGDENSLFFNCRLSVYYERLSELWCVKKCPQKAIDYLLLAEKCAVRYDSCNDLGEQTYKSIFANRCTFNPKNAGTNMDLTQRELLFDLMGRNVYDFIRETSEFQEIQKRLQK